MAEHISTDTQTDLIINRMSRTIYDQLSAENAILSDQLYLIEDSNFDVFNKRIVNVNAPTSMYDAVNLDYLSTYYIMQDAVTNYVDKSKLYSQNLSAQWPNGQTYICGDKKVYVKDTSRWNISVIKGSITSDDVEIVHNTGMGWQFKIGSTYFGQNMTDYPDVLHDTTTYSGEETEVSATSWHYQDMLIGKNEIYSCLSNINLTSDIASIRNALTALNDLLSS